MTALAGQTVTFTTFSTSGARDASGMAVPTDTSVDVPGCLHRPVPANAAGMTLRREYRNVGVVIGVNSWRTTAPVTPVTLGINTADHLTVDGQTYVVTGEAMLNRDMSGRASHVTILSERQEEGH